MLKENTTHVAHPLLPVSLVVEFIHTRIARQIHTVHDNLDQLEETTGQHEYINVALRDPLKTDFISATRRLNFGSRVIVVEKMRAASMMAALEMMLDEANTLNTSEAVRDSAIYVRKLIKSHMNVYRNLALRAEMVDN
jgi:hypothetical protein